MITNPISIGGAGGKWPPLLPAFSLDFKVTEPCIPESGYTIQFDLLDVKSFYQLVFFLDSETIGYGASAQPAAIVNPGGPVNVFIEPQASPMVADISTGISTPLFNSGKVFIRFEFDGNVTFKFSLMDITGATLWSVSQSFLETPSILRVEPVGYGLGKKFVFQSGGFRMVLNSQNTLTLLGTESPEMEVEPISGKPAMWVVGTAESSNLEMIERDSVTLDYVTI